MRTGAAAPPGKLSTLLVETTGNRGRKYVSLEIRALCVHTHTSREARRDTESSRLGYVWVTRTNVTTCTKMHRSESIESVTIPLLLGKCSPALMEAYRHKLTRDSISQQAQRSACVMEPRVSELKQKIEDTLCPFGFEVYPFQVGLSSLWS